MPIRKVLICLLLTLAGCADTDPYKRLEPAPTPALSVEEAAAAFNSRWPAQFKCVHTVTIDFRVTTRTMVSYLVVQSPDRFRLQGMTEHGVRMLDLVGSGGNTHVRYAADEVGEEMISAIRRDVARVFLHRWEPGRILIKDREDVALWKGTVSPSGMGMKATQPTRQGEVPIFLMGEPPLVDWYEYRHHDRLQYRVDHYEWQDYGGFAGPSIVVLRESGTGSESPAYKLTIRVTDLGLRDEPWPDSIFLTEGE